MEEALGDHGIATISRFRTELARRGLIRQRTTCRGNLAYALTSGAYYLL